MTQLARMSWPLAFLIGVGFAVAWSLHVPSRHATALVVPLPPALSRHTGVCDFKNVSLEAALDELSERTQCTVCVDWANLNHQRPSSRVSLGFDDAPLSKAINLLLWNATDAADDLAVWEDGGVVYITLHNEAMWRMEPLVTRSYDIHDIVMPGAGGLAVDAAELPPEFAPNGGGALFGSARSSSPAMPGPLGAHYDNVDQVIRLVETLVDADTWKENGGSIGSAQEMAHLLIVCQTPANHQRIESLLTCLRQARAANSRNAPIVQGAVDLFVGQKPTH